MVTPPTTLPYLDKQRRELADKQHALAKSERELDFFNRERAIAAAGYPVKAPPVDGQFQVVPKKAAPPPPKAFVAATVHEMDLTEVRSSVGGSS